MKLSTLKPNVKPINVNPTAPPVTKRKQGRPEKRERLQVLERDGYLCVKCAELGLVVAAEEVDHIIPLYLGGEDTAANKQSLCRSCHRDKSDREERERRGAD